MTQIIVDDQLSVITVLEPIQHWAKAIRLKQLRPREVIKDERVPTLLRTLRQPTFVTIDDHYWNRNLRDTKYCLVYCALTKEQQSNIPNLLRRLLRLSDVSHTRSAHGQGGARRFRGRGVLAVGRRAGAPIHLAELI